MTCRHSLLAERMRPIRHTLLDHLRVPIDRVVCLTDPARMATWLPACTGVEVEGPSSAGPG